MRQQIVCRSFPMFLLLCWKIIVTAKLSVIAALRILINSQIKMVKKNFMAISHPSLPNYIAFTSGGTQGITTDCNTCFLNAVNIFSSLDSAGKTWKSYHE